MIMSYNINLILAVDNNNAIGNGDDLLYFFPKDLRRFVSLTKEKTVVMGRKTWESLPVKLPKRKNIVLTKSSKIEPSMKKGVLVEPDLIVNDLDTILKMSENEEIWIIGGANIYEQFIKYTKTVELTKISATVSDYDTTVDWLEESLKDFVISNNVVLEDVDKMSNDTHLLNFITFNSK